MKFLKNLKNLTYWKIIMTLLELATFLTTELIASKEKEAHADEAYAQKLSDALAADAIDDEQEIATKAAEATAAVRTQLETEFAAKQQQHQEEETVSLQQLHARLTDAGITIP